MDKKEVINQSELTPEQVYSVKEFAQYLYAPMYGNNVYTPQLLYENLLNLNVLPKSTNYENVIKALENARANAKDIQGYSQFLEKANMLYERTMYYYTNLLSFDLWWTVREADSMTKADWKSKEYKDDLKRLHKFLDNFDYKSEFKKMTLEMLRREVVYTWFRQNESNKNAPKYTLQIMPQSRYMMTGYWENGILADFDMQYFLQPGVDIESYDPVFKKLFYETFTGENWDNYNPANQFANRDGAFATWVQLSPDDGSYIFKFDTSNFNTAPFLTPFIKDSLYNNDVQNLQRNKDMLEAMAILVGEIGMIDKSASGNTQNQTAFTPAVMGEFMRIAKSALSQTNIKPVALPLEGVRWEQFEDTNKEMYETNTNTVSSMGASAGRVIYSTDKTTQAEIQAQITSDYYIMEQLYLQFSKFLNFYVNKKMRKYHFNFTFGGCTQDFLRQNHMDMVKEVMDIGFVPNESYIGSILGIAPHDFSRMLNESSNGNLTNKLTQLQSIHTASGTTGDGKKGRPIKRGLHSSESQNYDDSNE